MISIGRGPPAIPKARFRPRPLDWKLRTVGDDGLRAISLGAVADVEVRLGRLVGRKIGPFEPAPWPRLAEPRNSGTAGMSHKGMTR